MGGGADGGPPRGRGALESVLSCCFEGTAVAKEREDAGSAELPARLNALLDALVAEWGSALPLLQVWMPKARGQRGGTWLSVDGAPFRMCDAALLSFRERSGELCFCRGQGLPGRVWATGAAEVIQDFNYVSVAQYSRRTLCVTEGLQEAIAVPIFARTRAGAAGLGAAAAAPEPLCVLEVVLASSQQAQNGSALAIQGRVRLSVGGTAAVLSAIGAAMERAGLSCCAEAEAAVHASYATTPPQQIPAAPPVSKGAEAAAAERDSARCARSSFDAARVAAGFVDDSVNGAGAGAAGGPCATPPPRRSLSLARTPSCRSIHMAATLPGVPCVQP